MAVSGGLTVPDMSPLRWLAKFEVKNYEGWPIFLRVVVVKIQGKCKNPVGYGVARHGQFLPVLEYSLT